MYSTVRIQTSICCFIIRSLCVKNGWNILYDRFLFNHVELHVDARLDRYSFDYTCIIINFLEVASYLYNVLLTTMVWVCMGGGGDHRGDGWAGVGHLIV